MKIVLEEYEQDIINKHAAKMDISPNDLADYYFDTIDSNFEQDVQDIINENYDDLTQEYGLNRGEQNEI